ncbi:phage portal protein [Citricoccus sp. K5]|uniref:phage portal protein n=1 Tax=Citricoccus sp. K5 TaxID=2653135 RepID=UPI0012EFB53A|nr:phage portal protein [Citricoccus sp. K5]VXB22816.1 Phage portal protein, SPP1 Gp6-like [Citricoccus sp. K5]
MTLTANSISAYAFRNVHESEADDIRDLLKVWHDRLDRNLKRTLYYDGEQAFKDLGLTLPNQLKNAKFCLGWATMAVHKAAVRSQYDGLRMSGNEDPFELSEILDANDFALEFSQSIHSAGRHGVSFVTVAKGVAGEPDVQIQAHSAESASALWDRRSRRIRAALTIVDMDREGPTEILAYLPHVILRCTRQGSWWTAERIDNQIRRTLVVPVRHDPQLTKPFGRSRITNPVMSLTDMAVRAYVRMEGNAEFYSSPQIAIEGIDPDAFDGNATEQKKFKLAMDRLIALTRDEDGQSPTIKQLQQATMTPHSDMLRTVAMAFSGETGIPPSSLGIIHDQPASAEAIRAAWNDMLIDVTYQNQYVYPTAVKQIMQMAVMVRDGLTEPPSMAGLSVKFADPTFPSLSALADPIQKLASSMDSLAKYPVLLEEVFDADKAERIRDDYKRSNAGSALQSLMQSRTTVNAEQE